MDTLKKILKPLASLYLTVPLLAVSLLLVYAGTTAQKQLGIQDVQKQYFHSFVAHVSFDQVLLPFAKAGSHHIPGGFPLPGGYTLIALLLINVIAAHAVRFKINWKRSGILLIHFSLILLFAGELIASQYAVESQMAIPEGGTTHYSVDARHLELAVIDPSPSDHDDVTVIPEARLHEGEVIDSAKLPFEVRVDEFDPNSQVLGPFQAGSQANPKATAGLHQKDSVVRVPSVPGTEGDRTDIASAYVTLRAGGQDLGRYLVSEHLEPERVSFNGKTYLLDLRPQRIYKPYSITLLHFSHDRYLGTDEAKNFASRIRLVDPGRHVDREVLIWMNHPLRYAGETFYQQRFMPEDKGTILQITHNPGMWLPYIALTLGGLGLLIHFGMRLINFLQWALAPAPAAPAPARGRAVVEKGQTRRLAPTTLPLIARPTFWTAVLAMVVGGLYVVGMGVAPVLDQPKAGALDLNAFGRLPVVSDGRTLPFDSLARNTLRILSGKETLKREDKEAPAIRWLLDGFSSNETFRTDKVIRIDHPEVLGALDLDPKQKYFSIADLQPHVAELQKQANLAHNTPADERDSFQRKVIQLADSVMLLEKAVMSFREGRMYVVPPTAKGEQWRTLEDVVKERQAGGEVPQAAITLVQCVDDYQHEQASSFNSDVAGYDKYLQESLPQVMKKVHFEAYFNRFEPFYLCSVLYVWVLVLAFVSWLGWRRPLGAAAFGLLVLTLLVHTFGLAARIWIQGRPPVTNLYSASIFVGWGVTVLCVGLEICWRKGIGTVAAATIGFVTLIVAHFLSTDAMLQPNGDTMAVLQAVLDTNLWLATHVVCITLGYSATFLAALLGIIFLGRGLLTTSLDKDTRKALAWMIYGIVCFAMFFSFVGTILGGIWADQSWGRFWGWDPKENGAILVVIFNALILHARWCGMVRERGMAVLAILGNVVTSWSFMGTNMLGIGLHAYGFMDQAVPWLVGFWVFNFALVAVGMIPTRFWRSYAMDDAPGFQMTAKKSPTIP